MAFPPARTYDEVYRPQFHFTARENWLNDPNGLVFYKGVYHLFFQHNPAGIDWGNMTWGHATSSDLVHWVQSENAILPDASGTIFSGSAVVDWENTSSLQVGREKPLIALYTCAGDTTPDSKGKPFTQCLAFSTDAGETWTKYPGNPIIPQITPGNRDPKVVWFEPTREWVMALYLEGSDFAILTSPDLLRWNQTQRFTFPEADECPDFFPMSVEGEQTTKWVFVAANGRYLVGAFDGERFEPEQAGVRMDFGPNFYAVQTYSDIPARDGRRIQIAWMRGGAYPGMPFNQQMGFPCRLTLHRTDEGFRIRRNPVKEIRKLCQVASRLRNVPLREGTDGLFGIQGDLWDVTLKVKVGSAKRIHFGIRGLDVVIDPSTGEITVADQKASLRISNGKLKLRALIDRSSIELFGNDGDLSFSACFLPEADAQPLSLTAVGGVAQLESAVLHALDSTWPTQP